MVKTIWEELLFCPEESFECHGSFRFLTEPIHSMYKMCIENVQISYKGSMTNVLQ